MRAIAATLAAAIVLVTPAAVSAAPESPKAAALAAGDWRLAAKLGASAADVVRALQATGQLADIVADESVVTIGPDNRVDVVALKPLPRLDPADTTKPDVRTANLGGSGFTFGARVGSIVLYPASAQSFASQGAPARP